MNSAGVELKSPDNANATLYQKTGAIQCGGPVVPYMSPKWCAHMCLRPKCLWNLEFDASVELLKHKKVDCELVL